MDSFEEVWQQVIKYCKDTMSETIYKVWIETIDSVDFVNGKVIIYSKNDFRNSVLKARFSDSFKEAFINTIGFEIEIDFVSLNEDESESEKQEEKEKVEEKNSQTDDLRSVYNFDNFIVGSSNKLAHAASWRVATAELGTVYNPLFIYGNSGLGKTHLMLAIQNEMKKRNKNVNIVYTTSENFMNEFISCITKNDNITFREKYRTADALFIDDIQFMKNKVSTQEEFFHTFNDLINGKRQIVITSDRPPKEIEGLDERIKNRFESGLIADIQPPDIETRIAIIMKKSEDHDLKLSKQIINYIAEKIRDNIRQIEGTINKIAAMQTLYGISPTMGSIQQIILDIETDNRPVSALVDEIIESVADKYDLTKDDLVSTKRNSNISLARDVSMYVIRSVTGLSLESIGNKFGGKKHSTVKHSIDIVEKKIQSDVRFKSTVFNIIKQFKDKD